MTPEAEGMSDIRTADAMPVRRDDPDEVVARLEEDIIFGRFAPGARLTEDALMSRYGTAGISCGRRWSMPSAAASSAARRMSAPPCGSIRPRKSGRSTRSARC